MQSRELDLSNNMIGGPVITRAIKFNKSLTALDITGNPIEDDGLWLIGGLLLEEDCACKLRSISTYAFTVDNDSVTMSLQDSKLEGGAVGCYSACSSSIRRSLISTSLAGIAASAAMDLALALQANKSLKSLDLARNALSTITEYINPNTIVEKGKKDSQPPTGPNGEKLHDTKGLEALASAVRASSSLEAITLEGGKLPVTQLKGIVKVKSLDLSRRNFSHISAFVLGTLLQGNTSITDLSLHSNELTPFGAKYIVERLTSTIRYLDIANTMRVEERSKTDKKGDKGKPSVQAISNVPEVKSATSRRRL